MESGYGYVLLPHAGRQEAHLVFDVPLPSRRQSDGRLPTPQTGRRARYTPEAPLAHTLYSISPSHPPRLGARAEGLDTHLVFNVPLPSRRQGDIRRPAMPRRPCKPLRPLGLPCAQLRQAAHHGQLSADVRQELGHSEAEAEACCLAGHRG